jgi:hypothetical protein
MKPGRAETPKCRMTVDVRGFGKTVTNVTLLAKTAYSYSWNYRCFITGAVQLISCTRGKLGLTAEQIYKLVESLTLH